MAAGPVPPGTAQPALENAKKLGLIAWGFAAKEEQDTHDHDQKDDYD
jgi:hypothetical protein